MFRQLARLAEEHELLEALPFLRGGADDEDDLIQDAIAALPPLVARFFFAPRGGPKAPPLLGRCFTLKKLSAPHDVREACLRGAANSFRFRAEYRWSACAVGFVAGFADGSAWSASWLVATSARDSNFMAPLLTLLDGVGANSKLISRIAHRWRRRPA
jgi:hypothetical protein